MVLSEGMSSEVDALMFFAFSDSFETKELCALLNWMEQANSNKSASKAVRPSC